MAASPMTNEVQG